MRCAECGTQQASAHTLAVHFKKAHPEAFKRLRAASTRAVRDKGRALLANDQRIDSKDRRVVRK